MQWRDVRRLSVRLSVNFCANRFFTHQENGRIATKVAHDGLHQRASRVCSRSRSRSKVTWYAHFFGFLEWATPSLTVWFKLSSNIYNYNYYADFNHAKHQILFAQNNRFMGSPEQLNKTYGCYVAAKATYIRLLYGQKWGFSALAP